MKTTTHQQQLDRITEWLGQIGQDRAWLAKQLGVSIGAVNGWYSIATKREIPGPTWKLLTLLFRNTSLGEPLFTFAEAGRVQKAMVVSGYHSFSEFARDAVVVKTEQELKKHMLGEHEETAALKVAEQGIDYPDNHKHG